MISSTSDVSRGHKLKKKLAKGVAAVKIRFPDVNVATDSTQNLLVVNGGIICGWDEESIAAVFEPFGQVESTLILVHTAFSFVRLNTVKGAEAAVAAINEGSVDYRPTQSRLYVAFVDKVPNLPAAVSTKLPGFVLHEDFVDEVTEQSLIDMLMSTYLKETGQTLKNRQVVHFGYTFLYGSNQVDLSQNATPVPSEMEFLIDQMMSLGHIIHRPNQVTVNVYQPGQGIPLHVDTHSAFEDSIVSLSLGADIVMEFRHPATGAVENLLLPTRSLSIMTGESRYVWSHGISPRKTDTLANGRVMRRHRRISVTFRCVRRSPCACGFPEYCDRKRSDVSDSKTGTAAAGVSALIPVSNTEAITLEKECVHKVYEEIADHFNDTRYSQWPGVKKFLLSLPLGSLLCDVGCGNGKYILPSVNDHLIKIGCDRCDRLIGICREKGCEVFVADGTNLPLASNRFDAAISIAVIHHLSTKGRRIRSVTELIRILRPNGLALIYVWAFEQRRDSLNSAYLKEDADKFDVESLETSTIPSTNVIPVHKNRTSFKAADLLVPWDLNKPTKVSQTNSGGSEGAVFYRFYHVFHENELSQLCVKVPSCRVVESYYEQGNWCVVLQKTQ